MPTAISLKEHAAYAPIIKEHVVQKEGERWGRLLCRWTEKNATNTIQHIFAACIDLQNGDIYLDCSKKKIWGKFCALLVIYPICLSLKTIYHLALPVSIPLEIFLELSRAKKELAYAKMTRKDLSARCIKQIGKNLADIARTPLYAIAMNAIGISAVIIGPFAPRTLYTLRATLGKVEKSLNRGDPNHHWTVFRCLQPYANLKTLYEWHRFKSFPEDTVYGEEHQRSETLTGMTHFARSTVNERKHIRHTFNNCGRLHPAGVPYISPIIATA